MRPSLEPRPPPRPRDVLPEIGAPFNDKKTRVKSNQQQKRADQRQMFECKKILTGCSLVEPPDCPYKFSDSAKQGRAVNLCSCRQEI